MKNNKWIVLTIISLLSVVSCSSYFKKNTTVVDTEGQVITLGSTGSDAQIWKYIAQSDEAKHLGLNIKVKEINDGVALNRATLDKEIDVNAFQSWGYLKAFNQLNHNQLAAIATTYLEPMGLYSKKYNSLKSLPENAVVAIPNDAANTARALRLLEQSKLIKLSDHFNSITGNIENITSNPKHLVIRLVEGSTIPRVLGDVDLAAIGNTVALDSGLNVLTQSLIHENVSDNTAQNINVLVVNRSRLNDETFKKLGVLYHQPFVEQYIQKNFAGTKVDVNQPVSQLPE
ncbi:MetQ/NlpA family ABC transporter substrate-binding protein [Acinetobacter nectaris]|uniref:MetQ/NlpA family ABC transporter substrate-binding protein n=1 Tax=Acinetobacter nectaris TaxID=1219382 RepID=UPI001F388249|nr:MetQ/NlpA family ABC transporter substrate-binding protein [Acinetobacter nectaris]MCF9035482.1 hypothetical protein [Acinetobacter nectaris]MCF9046082.1 hypothetical protein [Acinetobacter nectaris]